MFIPAHLMCIFVGCMLGDGYMDARPGRITKFKLKQSIINFPFLWHAYTFLSSYCAKVPRYLVDKKSACLNLVTRSYPVLQHVYDLFYVNGVKCINPELIHYLSPRALAY
jgi:hypothetical protein